MSKTKGELRVLHIKVATVYVPIGCLTSDDFTETTETLPTTTRASNGWKTFVPTNQEFQITFEGLEELDDSSIVSYNDLKTLKRDRTRIEWALYTEGTMTDEGFGYITSLGNTAAVGDFISFTGNILGYGEPVVVTLEGDLWQDGNTVLFQDGNTMIFQ